MNRNTIFTFAVIGLVVFTLLYSCQNGTKDKADENDTVAVDTTPKGIDLGQYDRYHNDISRFIAGLKQEEGSVLMPYDTHKVCVNYRTSTDDFFVRLDSFSLIEMKKFAQNELAEINNETETLFYPFSGPDFIHANAFFPNARTTIMFGLERVGDVPKIDSLTDEQLDKFFKAVRRSIDSLVYVGYFMTFEMGRDFNRVSQLRGTLPVIASFIARTGHRVLDIRKVTINQNGELVDSIPGKKDTDDPNDTYISGGVVEYMREGDLKPRKVYYFSHNVNNESLKNTPNFGEFLISSGFESTMLKAASYLCSWMSGIRGLILENSQFVVQDDSGIPLRYFDHDMWDLQFYGYYNTTLSCFRKAYFQRDLRKVYKTDTTVVPLKFGYGYGIRFNQSNIMVASKKPPVNEPDSLQTDSVIQ